MNVCRKPASTAAVIAVALLMGVTTAAPAPAAAAPVLAVATSRTLNCAVAHRDEPRLRFFADTSCATIVVVGNRAFGPAITPGFFPEARPTPFTPLSQSARTGRGTAADPWRVVTTVAAGTTGVRIRQVDTWTATSEVVQTRIDVANDARTAQRVVVWRVGDCQADAFESFGRVRPGKAACIVSTQDGADRTVARAVPGPQLMMFAGVGAIPQVGVNPGFGPYEIALRVLSGAAPTGGCDQCNESVDRVITLGWPLTLAPHRALTLRTTTTVSTRLARAASGLLVARGTASTVVNARLFSLGVPIPRRLAALPARRRGRLRRGHRRGGTGVVRHPRANPGSVVGRRRRRRGARGRPDRHRDVRRRPRSPAGDRTSPHRCRPGTAQRAVATGVRHRDHADRRALVHRAEPGARFGVDGCSELRHDQVRVLGR
jgi:hypothetical protein